MPESRLFKIVYFLLEKGKSTAPELADKFEVSIRTIYRDLDAISASGIPIYAAQGKGGGISLLPEFVLDKSLLSGQEKEQIMMALQGVLAVDNKNAEALLSKLGGLFQSKAPQWIEVDFSDWIKNAPKQNVFDTMKEAIFGSRILQFSYFGRNRTFTRRTVEPVKLIFKSKDWYLYGFCRLRNDFRLFKLTRVQDLEVLAETFSRQESKPFKIDPVIQNDRTVTVKLKFSPQAAFRIYDEFTNRITEDEFGYLYVSVDLPDNDILYSYLMTFMDAVQVLEPDRVRRALKEKLRLTLEKYET